MKSKFLSLDERDAVKGILVAGITAGLTTLMTMLNGGIIPSPSEWKQVGVTAVSAGIAYIVKNLLTNSRDKFGKLEDK